MRANFESRRNREGHPQSLSTAPSTVDAPPTSKDCGRTRSLMQNALLCLRICIVFAAAGATVLFIVPFSPKFPTIGLDPSWKYALNEAVTRHLVFGQDIIFTFGPLASAYTGMYHPATDWIMLCGSGVIGAGFSL